MGHDFDLNFFNAVKLYKVNKMSVFTSLWPQLSRSRFRKDCFWNGSLTVKGTKVRYKICNINKNQFPTLHVAVTLAMLQTIINF